MQDLRRFAWREKPEELTTSALKSLGLAAFFALLLGLAKVANALPDASLGSAAGAPGARVEVPLAIDFGAAPGYEFHALELSIRYDPALLSFAGLTNLPAGFNPADLNFSDSAATPGEYVLSVHALAPWIVAGSQAANLSFDIAGGAPAGASPLALKAVFSVPLVDDPFLRRDEALASGDITVTAVPEPASLPMLLLGGVLVLGCAMRRRAAARL